MKMVTLRNIFIYACMVAVVVGCLYTMPHYTRHAVITAVEECGDYYLYTADDGYNTWQFYDTELAYSKYEQVNLRMNDKGTEDDIFDDEIYRVDKVK